MPRVFASSHAEMRGLRRAACACLWFALVPAAPCAVLRLFPAARESQGAPRRPRMPPALLHVDPQPSGPRPHFPPGAEDLRASPGRHRGSFQLLRPAARVRVLEGPDSRGGLSGESGAFLPLWYKMSPSAHLCGVLHSCPGSMSWAASAEPLPSMRQALVTTPSTKKKKNK